jgi:hypothetical protein
MKYLKTFESHNKDENQYYIDICLSYRDKNYIEGETEKSVLYGIETGLKETGWKIDENDIDDAVDYQTNSTAIQFNLTVPKDVTKSQIIKKLSLEDLSVNIDKQ